MTELGSLPPGYKAWMAIETVRIGPRPVAQLAADTEMIRIGALLVGMCGVYQKEKRRRVEVALKPAK